MRGGKCSLWPPPRKAADRVGLRSHCPPPPLGRGSHHPGSASSWRDPPCESATELDRPVREPRGVRRGFGAHSRMRAAMTGLHAPRRLSVFSPTAPRAGHSRPPSDHACRFSARHSPPTRTLRLPATAKPANPQNIPDAKHQPCLSDPAANAQRAFSPVEHWNHPRGWRSGRRAPRVAHTHHQVLGRGRILASAVGPSCPPFRDPRPSWCAVVFRTPALTVVYHLAILAKS